MLSSGTGDIDYLHLSLESAAYRPWCTRPDPSAFSNSQSQSRPRFSELILDSRKMGFLWRKIEQRLLRLRELVENGYYHALPAP
jgi:hypothetical protein